MRVKLFWVSNFTHCFFLVLTCTQHSTVFFRKVALLHITASGRYCTHESHFTLALFPWFTLNWKTMEKKTFLSPVQLQEQCLVHFYGYVCGSQIFSKNIYFYKHAIELKVIFCTPENLLNQGFTLTRCEIADKVHYSWGFFQMKISKYWGIFTDLAL